MDSSLYLLEIFNDNILNVSREVQKSFTSDDDEWFFS